MPKEPQVLDTKAHDWVVTVTHVSEGKGVAFQNHYLKGTTEDVTIFLLGIHLPTCGYDLHIGMRALDTDPIE